MSSKNSSKLNVPEAKAAMDNLFERSNKRSHRESQG